MKKTSGVVLAGTVLRIDHPRKGVFYGRAETDFDVSDEFYPIILIQNYVEGVADDWVAGERIPCRNFCKIEVI